MTRNTAPVVFALGLLLAIGCRQADTTPAPAAPEPAPGPPPAEVAAAAPDIDIPNARMPASGVLTGGQPTVEQFEQAAAAGYRTVINLRAPGEEGSWDEAAKAAEMELRYVEIPIAGAEGLTIEKARRLAEIVADAEARPVMVHCASGNRVGALFALKAFHVDGEDAETALRIGREAGLTKLEEAVRERLTPAG